MSHAKVSSLPQGWHGASEPLKKTSATKSSEAVPTLPTLRKRWNAPQAPETPKTKLPLFRKNSMPTMPNGCKSKGVPTPATNAAGVSRSISQGKLPDCTAKPLSKSRESQVEIATLKKDLATFKAENSILRARVRRVDDENSHKTRQIEKLQAEIKNELLNSKKNKENESVLVLRQKCLRLDGALREKEQAIKKLVSELKMIKVEELKEIIHKYHKELGIQNGIGSSFFKGQKLTIQTTDNRTSPRPGRTNIRDQVSKSEAEKLRNMIHKLEVENQKLQNQVKEKDQEIRRLKLQLQRQNSKSNISTSGSSSRLAPRASTPRSSSPVPVKTPVINAMKKTSSSPVAPRRMSLKTPPISSATKTESQTKQIKRPPSSSNFPSASPNSTFVVKRVQSVPKQKPVVRRKSLSSTEADLARLELKVQCMRENVAARKIQKGWRNHRKMVNQDLSKEQERALGVILNELKAHLLRKEKLIACSEESSQNVKPMENDVENIAIKVETSFQALWEKSENLP